MYFVGLDLAWGEKNHTGVAVIDPGGRLLHVGSAQDDASIDAAIAPYVSDECLVAIDAPLIVPNAEGRRIAEIELGKDFMRFDAGPHSANKANPLFDPPRGAALCARLDLDMDPESRAERRAIEVFPHPATVVLFRLPKILKYKKGEVEDRRRELLQLMTLIEGLDKATPRLRVNHNVAWVELRNRIWFGSDRSTQWTLDMLRDLGLTHVMVDGPQGLESSVPQVTAVTNPGLAMIRLHGRRQATWEAAKVPTVERYRYLYSQQELDSWLPRLREAAMEATRTVALLNNCYGNYGTTNARELVAKLASS